MALAKHPVASRIRVICQFVVFLISPHDSLAIQLIRGVREAVEEFIKMEQRLMENLNKDLGPVRDGCGARLFIWSRETPSSRFSRLHM